MVDGNVDRFDKQDYSRPLGMRRHLPWRGDDRQVVLCRVERVVAAFRDHIRERATRLGGHVHDVVEVVVEPRPVADRVSIRGRGPSDHLAVRSSVFEEMAESDRQLDNLAVTSMLLGDSM